MKGLLSLVVAVAMLLVAAAPADAGGFHGFGVSGFACGGGGFGVRSFGVPVVTQGFNVGVFGAPVVVQRPPVVFGFGGPVVFGGGPVAFGGGVGPRVRQSQGGFFGLGFLGPNRARFNGRVGF